jgi:hypothetical protein
MSANIANPTGHHEPPHVCKTLGEAPKSPTRAKTPETHAQHEEHQPRGGTGQSGAFSLFQPEQAVPTSKTAARHDAKMEFAEAQHDADVRAAQEHAEHNAHKK